MGAPSHRGAVWRAAVLCMVIAWWSGTARAQASDAPTGLPSPWVGQLQGRLEPGKIVEVRVDGLAEWSRTPGHTPWRLVPYVNGRALAGLYPVAVNVRTSTVQFHLRITPENRDNWTHVLSPLVFQRPVRFSVGLELQDPFETAFTLDKHPAVLTVINPSWVVLAAAVVLVFSATFFYLATQTSLLMERMADVSASRGMRFSLAKVQLALWFFVVFGAFLVIWLVTGNFNTINSSIVATLGISVGTTLGDEYLKRAQSTSDASGVTALMPMRSAPASAPVRLIRFVRDVVSDNEGYSIYRFQMLAWTVALAIVFLADVYDDLVMPSFGPELLYLLGVSSGTYVAHRVPEMLRDRSRPDTTASGTPTALPVAPPPASPASSPWGAQS